MREALVGRASRVRAAREAHGVDALLISSLVNCRWLTGFTGSNAAVVVDDALTLITDSRYATAVGHECPGLPVALDRDAVGGALRTAAAAGAGTVGVEAGHLTVEDGERLRALGEEVGVRIVPLPSLVEPLRAIKDADEVALLREACRISERALDRLLPELRPGQTERHVAARLEWLMRDEGADAPAFESIVAAGDSSAEPHHVPTERPLARGDLLKLDFGARLQGYHADMTRTFVLGPPADWQSELHALVAEAAAAGRAALADGVELVAVDRAARGVIEAAGRGDCFGHGLGHGIGLVIHEAPMMGPRATGTLSTGMTVTVEPGVYLPGLGGVRIEDSLVVLPDGADPLTTTTRDLLVLG